MLGWLPVQTGGVLFRADACGSGIDRGTERTPARITAGSERYRLGILVHRSTPVHTGGRHQPQRWRPRSATTRATQVYLYPPQAPLWSPSVPNHQLRPCTPLRWPSTEPTIPVARHTQLLGGTHFWCIQVIASRHFMCQFACRPLTLGSAGNFAAGDAGAPDFGWIARWKVRPTGLVRRLSGAG